MAPPPPADPGLPSAAATVEIAKDDDGATRVADVADVASKTEEAVNKFTITASKASTVFRIDLAELRRMRIKQGKAPGISKYSQQKVSRTGFQYLRGALQSGAAYHLQGFEDKNLGSSPGLLGQ